MNNKPVQNHNSFQITPLTSRSISGLSSSTISSEPSTPTKTQLPSSFSDKFEVNNIDKSPILISQQPRLSEGFIDLTCESPPENPPLPPRFKDMTRQEFNFNSQSSSSSFSESFPAPLPVNPLPSVISPRLPPRLSRSVIPPPVPTRFTKD